MKLKLLFDVDTISRLHAEGGIQVYPNAGEPSPPSVGAVTTGRYVVAANRKGISGDYVYTRTNSYQTEAGHIVGNGTITFRLRHRGSDIRVTTVFTIRFTDPEKPFSVVEVDTPITSATVDGKFAQGYISLKPVRGGRQYKSKLFLNVDSKKSKEPRDDRCACSSE